MKRIALFAMFSFFFVTSPIWAHHSLALYDRANPITLTGTVTAYNFVNPHVQILLDVKDAQGNVEKWEIESGGPARLYRAGWNLDSVKPGDKVTVTGVPRKDGRKSLSIKKLVAPDGKVLTVGAG